jgi:hypothetical protein
MESYFFDPSSDDPRGPPRDSESKRTFLEIAAWLDRHCGEAHRVEDSDYGEVSTYLCPDAPTERVSRQDRPSGSCRLRPPQHHPG